MHGSHKLLRSPLEKNNPYVVGLDFSLTSTGVYMLSLNPTANHPDFYYFLPTSTKDGSDTTRIDSVATTIIEDLSNPLYPVIAVAIEDYGPTGKTAGKILVRAELCGIVKHFIRNVLQVPYYTVSPNGLKKFSTGSGKTPAGSKTKEVSIQAAADKGFDTKVNDLADAFHAAHFCEAVMNGEKTGVDYRRVNPKGFTFT